MICDTCGVDAVNESGQCTYCLAREADLTLTARAAAETETEPEPAEDVVETPPSPKRRKSRKRGKA